LRILHITQHKCGSQWVRDVLTSHQVARHSRVRNVGISCSFVTKPVELDVPESAFAGPVYGMTPDHWSSWRRPEDKCVVVTRDPRDVSVSMLFSQLYSHTALAKEVREARDALLEIGDFDARLRLVFRDVASRQVWFVSWSPQVADASSGVMVRYEDLVADQMGTFSRVADFLGWPVPHSELEDAIAAHSFEKRSGRPRGAEDAFSHYRRGTPGDWRRFFTRATGQVFEELMPGMLVAAGYEEASSWWEKLPASLERPMLPVSAVPGTLEERLAIATRRNTILEKQIEEKQAVIRELAGQCDARQRLIESLSTQLGDAQGKLARAEAEARASEAAARPLDKSPHAARADAAKLDELHQLFFEHGAVRARELRDALVEKERVITELRRAVAAFRAAHFVLSPMATVRRIAGPRLGVLYQHNARPMRAIAPMPRCRVGESLPSIALVTPSFNQAGFISETISSVLGQDYPVLDYYVQDGGSTDGTPDLLAAYGDRLKWESSPDGGQASAINTAFGKVTGDVMGYLNSDDLLLPGALLTIGRFFVNNPEIDVVYGDRLIIDENGNEIGAWRLPKHQDGILSWADFVPQETLFWRRSAWERAGGEMDEGFRFALDWDLLVRLRDTGARMAHIPAFLGAFRVHDAQKTTSEISGIGAKEMSRIRLRTLGREPTRQELQRAVLPYMLAHIRTDLTARVADRLRYRTVQTIDGLAPAGETS
jgi:GT2 family glycosyltransferase